MKMKGQSHSAASHGRMQNHHHHNNNNNNYNHNNNNNTAPSPSVKEAERRLSGILKSAKKISCTTEELIGLEAVKKLTEGYRGRWVSWLKHILPILVAVFALLMVYLLVYSFDAQSLGCLQNTSEPVVVTKESVPVTPRVMTAPRVSEYRGDHARRTADPQGDSAERWVASNGGQTLRKER